MVESGENFSDGSGVGDHTNSSHDLGKITSWNNGGGLIVDSDLESGGAPIDELNGSLGLNGGNSGIDILGDDITSVEHGASHILSVSGITFGHHIGWLEWRVGDFSNWELFVISLLSGDDGGIWRKHKVDSGIWHQVGLKFGDIDVEGSIESEGGGQWGDDLSDQSVQVSVGGSLDVKISSTDIIDGFVVEHDTDISVLEEGMGGEDGVVWFNDCVGDLGWGIDSETKFGFFTIIDWQSLE